MAISARSYFVIKLHYDVRLIYISHYIYASPEIGGIARFYKKRCDIRIVDAI